MKQISVQLTFTDDDWYEWFVAPKKAYGELPTLILRLLRAYSENDELAMEIDQFLDKDEEPEIFSTRAAIQDALNKLGNLDNTMTQDLNALDDSMNAIFNDDDDDVIVTDADGKAMYTPESVASDLGTFMGFDPSKVSDEQMDLFDDDDSDTFESANTLNESLQSAMSNAAMSPSGDSAPAVPPSSTPVQPTQNDTQIDKILTALGMMTSQVSQLTETVSTLVSMNVNNTSMVQRADNPASNSMIPVNDTTATSDTSTVSEQPESTVATGTDTDTLEQAENSEALDLMDAALASLDF